MLMMNRAGRAGWRSAMVLALGAGLALAAPAGAQDSGARGDLLNATLWMQKSVEYKAATLAAFTLARMRLNQALADRKWTGAPDEQKGDFHNLPPAVVLDVDETLVDNSGYQAWMAVKGASFTPGTWTAFVNSETAKAIPGAVEFCKYAESKGVKVFYISNRTAEEEPATRRNMEKLGFPMGGNVDTVLTSREQPDWTSAKSTRRAYVAKSYRILLNLGDNFGDFTDAYRGTEAERLKVFEANKDRWGREWIMLPNPTYGSFESAAFNHDFKKTQAEQNKAKLEALEPWKGQ
ncbi:MAG: 5'-nucleotidase, lipoprotein e(P4) family [Alphaproteobacteria bacterium]|nr:5'-nucleotidase, lipoprotein e(P4) family [Alphaproteobacteria bacterium]